MIIDSFGFFKKTGGVWHMSCSNKFPTNRQLVFSSFFPFLKKAVSSGAAFFSYGLPVFYVLMPKAAGSVR